MLLRISSLAALVFSVNAVEVLTAQWIVGECTGVPNAMYGFDLKNTSATKESKETWPIGYKFQAKQYPISRGCIGTVKVPLSQSCCASSIDLGQSYGIESASTIEIMNNEPSTAIPKTANGGRYCYLESTGNSTLFGFKSAWYQANSKCIQPDSVSCNNDGQLSVYPRQDCTGEPELLALSTTDSSIKSQRLGTVRGKMVVIDNAKATYSWTVTQPRDVLLPNLHYTSDIIMVILYGLSWISLSVVCLYLVKKFQKKRTQYMLGIFLSQYLWLTYITVRMFCSFSTFSKVWDATTYALLLLASLTSVLNVTWTFFLFLDVRKVYRFLIMTLILLIHVALAGGQYLRYTTVSKEIDTWRKTTLPYWMLFMFIVNCSLPIFVAYTLLKVSHKSFSKRISVLYKADPVFCWAVIFQVLNMIAYYVFVQIRDGSDLLGSDRAWLAGFGVLAALLAFHGVLNYILINQMDSFVNNRSLLSSSAMMSVSKSQTKSANKTVDHISDSSSDVVTYDTQTTHYRQ
ncbi:hypothetical protein HDV02_003155 [Globomyces sp. JEL0801]|nr:hypothetical protein HDV02_003155 [Globomyces sp. JEL0801]